MKDRRYILDETGRPVECPDQRQCEQWTDRRCRLTDILWNLQKVRDEEDLAVQCTPLEERRNSLFDDLNKLDEIVNKLKELLR